MNHIEKSLIISADAWAGMQIELVATASLGLSSTR
jgi:hypothetical protein